MARAAIGQALCVAGLAACMKTVVFVPADAWCPDERRSDVPREADIADGASPCPDGRARCADACVELAADPAHCGACDAACALLAPRCVAGACVLVR